VKEGKHHTFREDIGGSPDSNMLGLKAAAVKSQREIYWVLHIILHEDGQIGHISRRSNTIFILQPILVIVYNKRENGNSRRKREFSIPSGLFCREPFIPLSMCNKNACYG